MFEGFESKRIATSGAEINLVHGGKGPPVLLLHGYPQTHAMWHKIAPILARRYTVVAADLRGYGDSSKPPGLPDHSGYAKRAMAQDMVEVMGALGFDQFHLVGHDRGARVAHRFALDHPRRVRKLAMLDIVPTRKMYAQVTREFATAYFHWFFLIQPADFPERVIGADPEYFLLNHMGRRKAGLAPFTPAALAEYLRCFKNPAAIHASCEDYRAAASIDLEHDAEDAQKRIECPLLALWGEHGVIGKCFSPITDWQEAARDVRGRALPCGHYLAEELPQDTARELVEFLDAA